MSVNISQYDQRTFIGRLKHYFVVTDPRTIFVRDDELEQAKELVCLYQLVKEPPGIREEQLQYARKLYASAFHPDSGEKQNIIGRMSFQVPGGMAITGFMLQFYRSTSAVIFWQWVNQSFNALVNYTNRNAKSPLTPMQIGIAYVSATTSAVVTAVGLKSLLQKQTSNLLQRFVPFAAVAAANCVNIPLMRQSELTDGVTVCDENGNMLTESKVAAVKGISQVVISRIIMAAPGMLLCPVIMEQLEKYPWMQCMKPLHAPFQVSIVGCFLIFMVPFACALFPQQCQLRVKTLQFWEPNTYLKLENISASNIEYVYFNKGL